MIRSLRKQQGIGLMESILTTLIIAGAAIALLRFQNYLQYSNNMSQEQNDAIQLAVNQIEKLRDFSALTGTNSYSSLASGNSTSTGVNTTYTITWTVTPTASPSYTVINVNVTWTDRYGNSQAIEQTSEVAGLDPEYEASVM